MTESASETISAVEIAPGDWRYTITLKDTGPTPIGTLWFSWIPGAGYLSSAPTFASPAGWTASITDGPPTGYSIQWVAASSASALQPGQSVSAFSFTTSTPPSVIFGDSTLAPATPIDTSTIYSGTPFSDPGFIFSAAATSVEILSGGLVIETDKYFIATAKPYSTYAKDYSAGGDFIGSRYFYTGIVGQAYAGKEVDTDGAGRTRRILFTGVTAQAYSSYEVDSFGGVRSGVIYHYTSVPAGAAYSRYDKDYNRAGALIGERFFYDHVVGQAFGAKEVDENSAGVETGYKEFFTGISGQSYKAQEKDFTAANQLVAVIDSGMSGAYSSVETDYSGGAVVDRIDNATDVKGQNYYADHLKYNAKGVLLTQTFDLNSGGHVIVGHADGQRLMSVGFDKMTGGGASETFVFTQAYGSDAITDFAAHDAGANHDVISFTRSEFTNFSGVLAAASDVSNGVLIKAADGDSVILIGLSKASLATLSADFTFHF